MSEKEESSQEEALAPPTAREKGAISRVMRLTVGKGKTIGDEKAGEWTRQYFEVQIAKGEPRQ